MTSWHFESYDAEISAGSHVIVALVWTLGRLSPFAQMRVKHGFLLVPEEGSDLLATGVAPWDCKQVTGLAFHRSGSVGPCEEIAGHSYPWGIERGEADGWMPATEGEKVLPVQHAETPQGRHLLQPALLPAQYHEVVKGLVVRETTDAKVADWQSLCDGISSVEVAGDSRIEVLLDCDEYVCVYPSLIVSGGDGARLCLVMTDRYGERNRKVGKRRGRYAKAEKR